MGVEGLYGKKITAWKKKHPELGRGPKGKDTYSVFIDANGLLHFIASKSYAYANTMQMPFHEKKKRQAEMLQTFRNSKIEANTAYSLEELKENKLMFKEWTRLVGSKVRTVKKLTPLEFKDFEDWLRPQTTDNISRLERETDKYKNILKKIYSKNLFDTYTQDLKLALDDILTRFKPRMTLFIAIDGVVPLAKVKQQRTRRFKRTEPEESNFRGERSILEEANSIYKFNGSAEITPGTEWMINTDQIIRDWINETKTKIFSPREIVYSSFMESGEGEHKIMSYLRSGAMSYQNSNLSNIIIGKDADLIFLSLISPVGNIIINREEATDFVNINEVRNILIKEMSFPGIDEKTLFNDFALVSMFIGNDFLPSIYFFKDVNLSLDLFISIYKSIQTPLSDEYFNINWSGMFKFIRTLAKYDGKLIKDIIDFDWEYPPTLLRASISDDEFDYHTFQQLWYANCLLPRNEQCLKFMNDSDISLEIEDDDIEMVCRHYLYGINWVFRYYTSDMAKFDYSYPYYYAPLVLNLQQTLDKWLGDPNAGALPNQEDSSYRYKYTVRFDKITGEYYKDFAKYDNKPIDKRLEVFQQLAVVLPPQINQEYVPEKISQLTMSRLGDLMPYRADIELDTIAKRKEHQGLLILPIVNIDRILKNITSKSLTKEYAKDLSKPKKTVTKKNYRRPPIQVSQVSQVNQINQLTEIDPTTLIIK